MNVIYLTGFGDLLRAIGVLFWLLVIAALIAAVKLPNTRAQKAAAVMTVVGLFAAFPRRWAWEEKQQRDAVRARHEKVEAMFQERCKKAGVFIHKTAENVEGVMLLKLRPTNYSAYNQYADDPYGYDFDWGNNDKPPPYIGTFLVGKDENGLYEETKPIVSAGYRYVEAFDPNDGKRYRYTAAIRDVTHTSSILIGGDGRTKFVTRDFVVEKETASGKLPRYGVTFDDISTREERDHWIAGSSLKVIDLQNNEVIAERIGYMVDFAQGATPGGRQPWTFAKNNAGWSCPALKGQSYGARRFVEKVLLIHDAQLIMPSDAAR